MKMAVYCPHYVSDNLMDVEGKEYFIIQILPEDNYWFLKWNVIRVLI